MDFTSVLRSDRVILVVAPPAVALFVFIVHRAGAWQIAGWRAPTRVSRDIGTFLGLFVLGEGYALLFVPHVQYAHIWVCIAWALILAAVLVIRYRRDNNKDVD